MKLFKSIILPMQGHNKSNLHWLYNTRLESDPERVYSYSRLKFWFAGTSHRSSEKMILYIQIPADVVGYSAVSTAIPCETYLLRLIEPIINRLSSKYLNADKNVREKTQFEVQHAGGYMARRNGIHYDVENHTFVLRLHFNVPLVNALSVNAKATIRAIKDILEHVEGALNSLDRNEMKRYIDTYACQQEIRQYMDEHNLCSFIANGSILPRQNGSDLPLEDAVPFVAPRQTEITIPFSDGTQIVGMGLKKGITVITGGGYSGKSTLLDAIEKGIYNHIPGDGREFVLTDQSALKICAEDGRWISNIDISPFFKFFPMSKSPHNFSTLHASGSVSQAANIIEAVCGNCKLLLIDEDKSATNFMIRDSNMRLVVKKETIIPFTDRMRELYNDKDVSTILVIGGSSEYFSYADTIILMEDYFPQIITDEVQKLNLPIAWHNAESATWMTSRKLPPQKKTSSLVRFKNVKNENEKKIVLDEYSADITSLSALISRDQLNTLTCVMEELLVNDEKDGAELLRKSEVVINKLLDDSRVALLIPELAQLFCEEIRPIDAFCCLNRMRGVSFVENDV